MNTKGTGENCATNLYPLSLVWALVTICTVSGSSLAMTVAADR